MSEDVVRLLLNDAAGGDAPSSTADAATLFARARSANRRRAAVTTAALVLLVLAGTGAVLQPQRPDGRHDQGPLSPSTSASPTLSARPSGRVMLQTPPASGPFCGWDDGLAPAVMAGLPVTGVWGTPSRVFGICSDHIGVQLTVTEAGKTGQVAAVVSRSSPGDARKNTCDVESATCEQLPNGYLSWYGYQQIRNGRTNFTAGARLATTSGVLIDITCLSDAYDTRGQQLNAPPMDQAACTKLQARALALELVKTNWLP